MPLKDSGLESFIDYDKIAHFMFYFIMSILICRTIAHRYRLVIAVLFCAGYGYLMEVLQNTMQWGRHFDYFDIIANIIGALAGTFVFYILNKTIWET